MKKSLLRYGGFFQKRCCALVFFKTLLMVNFGQKTAIFSSWNFPKKKKPPKLLKYCLKPLLVSKKLPDKNLKPLLVSQKLPKLQFRGGNRRQKAEVTNFKIWNFGAEVFEINFKCWNMLKCQHFWLLSHQFSCKSCC